MTITTTDQTSSTPANDARSWAGKALLATFALLYAELFLTADAASPNTWTGLVTDSVVLAVAGGLALVVADFGRRPGRARSAVVIALVLTLLFSLPFWTGSAIVLGTTTYALGAGRHQVSALVGAALAALTAGFLLYEIVAQFAPGLPS